MISVKIIRTFSLIALLSASASVSANDDDPLRTRPVQGEMKLSLLEDAAEFESLNVALIGRSSGTVTVQACSSCPQRVLKLTSDTELTVAGHGEPLQNIVRHRRKAGVAFFEPETATLTRITIY